MFVCTFLCYERANTFFFKPNNESFAFEKSKLQKASDIILEYPKLINHRRTNRCPWGKTNSGKNG